MAEPSFIERDDSRWPLVVVTFSGEPTLDEHRETLAWYAALLERGGPMALLFDDTHLKRPPRAVNEAIAAFMREHHDALNRHCVGAAMVIPNVLLRMALRSLFYLAPLPMIHVVVRTFSEAEMQCLRWLREAGVATSDIAQRRRG